MIAVKKRDECKYNFYFTYKEEKPVESGLDTPVIGLCIIILSHNHTKKIDFCRFILCKRQNGNTVQLCKYAFNICTYQTGFHRKLVFVYL